MQLCPANENALEASFSAASSRSASPWTITGVELPSSRFTFFRAAQELEFGGVTVNEAPTFRADQMPYGGVKDSGNTREGPAYAVRELTEERVVVIDL